MLILLLFIKGQSKTANMLFTIELTRRYAKDGIYANSVMPGYIMTDIFSKNFDENQLKAFKLIEENGCVVSYFKSVEQGAAPSVWAAIAPEFESKGGLYLEDFSISEPVATTVSEYPKGYYAYALDPENAKKLWNVSEELLKNPPNKANHTN
jgi:NAD(P)-dependent dehydrogenase (short-subunit alcohol dehydrogenase family)